MRARSLERRKGRDRNRRYRQRQASAAKAAETARLANREAEQ